MKPKKVWADLVEEHVTPPMVAAANVEHCAQIRLGYAPAFIRPAVLSAALKAGPEADWRFWKAECLAAREEAEATTTVTSSAYAMIAAFRAYVAGEINDRVMFGAVNALEGALAALPVGAPPTQSQETR